MHQSGARREQNEEARCMKNFVLFHTILSSVDINDETRRGPCLKTGQVGHRQPRLIAQL